MHNRIFSIHISKLIAVMALPMMIAACSDSTTSPTTSDPETAAMLKDVANNVILQTYVDLDNRADSLVQAVDALKASTSETTLAAARTAWQSARRPWEQSEAFLFGPVETKGIDPGIDSWPVNKTDLDAVLASSAVLTKEYVDGLEGTLKGFHTIEYLLFGTGGKNAADFTPRQLEYLTAVVRSFKGAVAQLRAAWEPTGGNYTAQLANAGEQASVYPSQKSAVEELVDGMAGIADEVGNGKINDPYVEQNRALEESQFSNNSNSDFQDNIRSIRNIYLGTYGTTTGKGITTLVAAKNSTLDARVRQEIDAAIDEIGQMTPTFGEAIFSNKPKVDAAQTAVRTLQQTIDSEVKPLLVQ